MASKRKSAAPAAEVEVVDKPGLGIEDGIVIMTTLLLLGAIICMVLVSQKYA
jgi:hypothetical protein